MRFLSAVLTTAALVEASWPTIGLLESSRWPDTPSDNQLVARSPPQNKGQGHGNPHNKRFLNKNSRKFQVKSMPEVDFDIGEMYAGRLPVKSDKYGNSSEGDMFFIFKPAEKPVEELVIWLNGGPGCSSSTGFLQENGPFLWLGGTYRPVKNPYAWSNVTNMLWVDQPIGTGYSSGPITAESQKDLPAPLMGFVKNFQDTFGIKNYKIYMAGESYAGRYIPYMSNAMVQANDPEYFKISGILMYSPTIGNAVVQQHVTVYDYVKLNQKLYGFNDTFMEDLRARSEKCGYEDFLSKYLQFPPPEAQPIMEMNYSDPQSRVCMTLNFVNRWALGVNPCFNPYQISDLCPIPWDVSGFARGFVNVPAGTEVYFDRADVKRALNAPTDIEWAACGKSVFVGDGSDNAPDSIVEQLPNVIDATQRVLIGGSALDGLLTVNSLLLSIQNMTWGGQLGFQAKPSEPFIVDQPDLMWSTIYANSGMAGLNGPQGQMGIQHFERGLLWVETQMSGHMLPAAQPRAAYRHLQWLVGRIDKL